MKQLIQLCFAGGLLFTVYSCSNANANRYIDLTTGESVEIEKDVNSGFMVNKATGKPVVLYVDTKTNDTIYGLRGKVVNGLLVKAKDGKYKYEDPDLKVKIEEDGDYKAKSDDAKLKVDDDGYKYKRKSYKQKVDDEGNLKIKNKRTKTKIDGETGERKTKERSVLSKVKEKVID